MNMIGPAQGYEKMQRFFRTAEKGDEGHANKVVSRLLLLWLSFCLQGGP